MLLGDLGGHYQLDAHTGRGGVIMMSRGRDLHTDRVVLIKFLYDTYNTDLEFVTRFQREMKRASTLQHPNIVQVYDYGQSDGRYFIVMEPVEGIDLFRYLRSLSLGVFDVDRAVTIAHGAALGLGAAHRRNIVHRYVRPLNIVVGQDGLIKMTDFGIGLVDDRYYTPEQAKGEAVTPATDVYALGIVMYEMLTGRTPFDGDSPVAVAMQHIYDIPTLPSLYNPNLPSDLEAVIMRCLEKVPEIRFRDGHILARVLESLGYTK